MSSSDFNEQYYESGVKHKISGYENFSWQPTRSYSEAISICDFFSEKNILDYGCAKGFLVHALRQLGRNAHGEDISEYAISNCHPAVKNYISLPTVQHYDLVIGKDILEHITENDIQPFLCKMKERADRFFFVVPLGENNLYRIREYEIDVTHMLRKDEDWWIDTFVQCGFVLQKFTYDFGSIKKKWVNEFPFGNGFFVLS